MSIQNLVHHYNLQQADVIHVKRNFIGILGHFVVYMGQDEYGEHWFMANLTGGAKWLSVKEIAQLAQNFWIKKIRKFTGSRIERQAALQRAVSLEGRKYNLFTDNCEHFANYVQTGRYKSGQAQLAGTLAVGAVIFGLVSLLSNGGSRSRR